MEVYRVFLLFTELNSLFLRLLQKMKHCNSLIVKRQHFIYLHTYLSSRYTEVYVRTLGEIPLTAPGSTS
nr:Biomphalaria glabrata D(2) dopamine receptor A-like; transcript variant X2 [Biomphalaria glabrata]